MPFLVKAATSEFLLSIEIAVFVLTSNTNGIKIQQCAHQVT